VRTLITAAIAALAIPASAIAAGSNDPGYSPPSQIPQSAQCGTGAGSGAFGALGHFGSGSEAGGADGYQTGVNNSAVCGNR
jgi:hypothetical protein